MDVEHSVKNQHGVVEYIDRVVSWVGMASGYLVLPLVAVIVWEVVARYIFNAPTIWVWEVSRFIGGPIFMLALGYLYLRDQHIRVDVLYSRWKPRTRAAINVAGALFVVFPVLIPSLKVMYGNAILSWTMKEFSSESAWRVPIYPFVAILPLANTLLLLAVVAKFVRDLRVLIRGDHNG